MGAADRTGYLLSTHQPLLPNKMVILLGKLCLKKKNKQNKLYFPAFFAAKGGLSFDRVLAKETSTADTGWGFQESS